VLDDRDTGELLALCDRDPAANVFVSSRVLAGGLDPVTLGAQMWGFYSGRRLESACYAGANLVPVEATPTAVRAFAERARRQGRRCSSLVGPAAAVGELWDLLRPYWGPARAIRAAQPVMATSGPPQVTPDPAVRQVRLDQLGIVLPACVAMFTEEVGVSPAGSDGGALYRARVIELISSGRAFARIEHGRVVFKAEIGAVTPAACQVQGVWVDPRLRGHGLAAPGMAAVVAAAQQVFAPMVTLYVNDFNTSARAAYRRAGFADVGVFMSVLF
jgi:predicted GNAT family acetyltransferase